jgi:hypothetical protein
VQTAKALGAGSEAKNYQGSVSLSARRRAADRDGSKRLDSAAAIDIEKGFAFDVTQETCHPRSGLVDAIFIDHREVAEPVPAELEALPCAVILAMILTVGCDLGPSADMHIHTR